MYKIYFSRLPSILIGLVSVVLSASVISAQNPAATLSISASPPVPTVRAGASGICTINVLRTGGMVDPVTLSAPTPAGWAITFAPNPVVGSSSVMTIAAPLSASDSLQTITVIGAAGTRRASTQVFVNVPQTLPPFYTIFASRANQTLDLGTSITNSIVVNRLNFFDGPVTFSADNLPTGLTATFAPNPTTGPSSLLTLTASPTAITGTAVIVIKAVGAPGTRTTEVNLTASDPTRSPCGTPTVIPMPFARDGAGDFCFVTSAAINSINSWNMQLLEINHVPFTNVWSNKLPPRINGNYYIHYVSNVSFAHFEASAPLVFLQASPITRSFGSAASSAQVLVFSNTNWTLSDNQPWITVSPVSGANSTFITLSVAANPSTAIRTGAVTVIGGGVTQTIPVTQSGVP